MKWPLHGSNPQYIYEAMNIQMPKQMIDLSANINPLGPPKELRDSWIRYFDRINDYPDPFAKSIRLKIANRENIGEESVLIGNGGAELIHLLGRMLARNRVLIIQPTFSEYEKACVANECTVHYHHLDEDWDFHHAELQTHLREVQAVFLCNPSNPTGVYFPYEKVAKLAQLCAENDCLLIIDEAFYDFLEVYQSLVPLIKEYENLILIRSMTKMFAIPGLRLGYLISSEKWTRKLSVFQSHWSVNTVAMLAGEQCLELDDFVRESVAYTASEKRKLFSFYEKEGFQVSPSAVNFYLLRYPMLEDQFPLFEYLLRRGIVLRHTMNFPGLEGKWLRVAIKSTREHEELLDVLKDWKA